MAWHWIEPPWEARMISRTPDTKSMPRPDPDPMLSLLDLRHALTTRGLEFSDSQLKRLRREGLLPAEGQRHLAGVRGSVSLYPGWAVSQLELVARLAAKERRFAQLRVLVRWHAGWVRSDKLRESLIGLLEPCRRRRDG